MPERSWNPIAEASAVFVLALGVYAVTLAPTVVWGDSATLATVVARSSLFFGTAGDHPLFFLLGRGVLPFPGELAFKLNLLTAAFGALAITFVYAATARLGGSRLAATGAAVALGLSHTFWHYSVITSVRTLNALFLALLIWMLAEWRAGGARPAGLLVPALVFAVGLTNHLVLALALPGLAFFVVAARPDLFRRRTTLALLASLAILVAAVLLWSDAARAAIRFAWYGPPPIFHYVVHWPAPLDLARELAFYAAYLAYQFPGPALALGFVGGRALWRDDKSAAIALLLVVAVNGGVFVKTTEWVSLGSSKVTFYLADYVVFAVFTGLGLAAIADVRDPSRAACCSRPWRSCPSGVYAAAPRALAALGIDPVRARDLPYRDEARFFLTPSKRGDDSARRYGEDVHRVTPPGSAIVADSTPMAVLLYLRDVEGRRSDLALLAAIGRTGADPRGVRPGPREPARPRVPGWQWKSLLRPDRCRASESPRAQGAAPRARAAGSPRSPRGRRCTLRLGESCIPPAASESWRSTRRRTSASC